MGEMPQSEGQSRTKWANGKRVLVVDDDAAIRAFLAEGLELLGYEVAEAASGLEAVKMFGEGSFDLVLVDYAMPGMNGVETARELRGTRHGQPVLLVTGFADAGTIREQARDMPILAKPFTVDELRLAVASALRPRS